MTVTEVKKKSLFEGFDKEARGPWPNGRYSGVIMAGYDAGTKVYKTEDRPSANGDSRNLYLCVTVIKDGTQTQNLTYMLNYRPSAMSEERIAEVQEARLKYKGQQNWPDKDAQRDNLAYVKLHELEKAGINLEFENGQFDVDKIIGSQAKFYLNTERKVGNDYEVVPSTTINDKSIGEEERIKWFNRVAGVHPPDVTT